MTVFKYLNMIDPKKIAECWQPLFDLMQNEHGLTLLESEMQEIHLAVSQVDDNFIKYADEEEG